MTTRTRVYDPPLPTDPPGIDLGDIPESELYDDGIARQVVEHLEQRYERMTSGELGQVLERMNEGKLIETVLETLDDMDFRELYQWSRSEGLEPGEFWEPAEPDWEAIREWRNDDW